MPRLLSALLVPIVSFLLAGPARGEWPPPILAQFSVVARSSIEALGVDADGEIFILNGWFLEKYDREGHLIADRHTGVAGHVIEPRGIAVDAAGVIYVADTYAFRIQTFTNDLYPLEAWEGNSSLAYPQGLVVAPDHSVYTRTQTQVVAFREGGVFAGAWPAQGSTGLALDPDGRLVLARFGTIYYYTPDGTLVAKHAGRSIFNYARGILVDERGTVVITDVGDSVVVYDDRGVYRGSIPSPRVRALALDDAGNLYMAGADWVARLAPVAELPPPPPPPEPAQSVVMLHIALPDKDSPCAKVPGSVSDIRTSAEAREDGTARYFVYLLASAYATGEGIGGIQLGVDHDGGVEATAPLRLLEWKSCAVLQWPTDHWPASGSGNTLTWVDCQYQPIVVAGYIYVSAYAPAMFAVAGYPATGVVKTATCRAAEDITEQNLGPDRVGWVSLGGAQRGTDPNGCNPALEPCASDVVPVTPVTWGRLKQMYGPRR